MDNQVFFLNLENLKMQPILTKKYDTMRNNKTNKMVKKEHIMIFITILVLTLFLDL